MLRIKSLSLLKYKATRAIQLARQAPKQELKILWPKKRGKSDKKSFRKILQTNSKKKLREKKQSNNLLKSHKLMKLVQSMLKQIQSKPCQLKMRFSKNWKSLLTNLLQMRLQISQKMLIKLSLKECFKKYKKIT